MTAAALLSIIIPVFNERSRIAGTIERLLAHFSAAQDVEIIIVDDGSTDGTAAAVAEQARRMPAVRLLRLERNQGKGAAVRRGMLAAAGAVRCFCDADLAIPAEEIKRVARAVSDGADMAIASRAARGARVVMAPGPLRALMSRVFNLVVRGALRLPYGDTQCGCKAFSASAAQRLFEPLRTPGFVFDVELLLRARRLGLSIIEVPVRVENSQLSTVNLMGHAGSICRDLARLLATRR